MISFKQFLLEMPVRTKSVPRKADLSNGMNLVAMSGTLTRLPGEMKTGHVIYHRKPESDFHAESLLAVDPKTNNIHARLNGELYKKSFKIYNAEKSDVAPFKMHEFSHHLLSNHIKSLESSDEHSPGSVKHWKDLSERPDIKVSRHLDGKPMKLHTGINWDDNYSKSDDEDAAPSVFVAKLKKPSVVKEDRLRSPAEVLQRAARRYGPHIKGKVIDPEWGELDKHKLVPLKNYNREKADEVYDKYDELPTDFPRHKDVSVPIKGLNPGQEYVNFSDREKLDKKLTSDSDRILIVKHKNEHYALDGHHKIFTEWGKGKTHITPTEYVDMDGYNPKNS